MAHDICSIGLGGRITPTSLKTVKY